MSRRGELTQTARGGSALNAVFGDAWSKLNRETAKRDDARALTFMIPCPRHDCKHFASVTVGASDELVCRHCANKDLGL